MKYRFVIERSIDAKRPRRRARLDPGDALALNHVLCRMKSTGPSGASAHREPQTKFLTTSQAEQFEAKRFLSSPGGWDPTQVE